MKKITLLVGLLFISLNHQAQNQTLQIEELLQRYQEIPPNGSALTTYFSIEEIAILQSHFSTVQEEEFTANTGGGAIVFGNNASTDNLATFSTDSPETISFIGANSGSADFEAGGDIDPTNLDRAYALTLTSGEFYEVDITTAAYTFLGIITPPVGENWNGLEFDPETNILYAISSNFAGTSTLSTIDIVGLTATPIGVTGMAGAISIAIDGSGNFYSHDVVDDSVYTVDPITGQATFIGAIGFDANFGQDLEWDPATGTMFMTAFNNTVGFGELRTVDLATGNTTLVGAINDGVGSQISWASIANDGSLSIDNPEQTIGFTFYPNPARQSITLSATTLIDNVTIFNVLGQKVLQNDLNATTGQLPIDSLKNGLYLMQISSNNQSITKRFIKN